MMRRRWALLLLVSLHFGCARNPDMQIAMTLADGLTALSKGDYAGAERLCLEATSADAERRDAQECVLLAAVYLHHWAVAATAAEKLTSLLPTDVWMAAVAVQVRHRHDPSVQLAPLLDLPEMAWACMDIPCALPASSSNEGLRMAAALYQVRVGDLQGALTRTAGAIADSALDDLHLLVLAKLGDYPELRKELAERPCPPPTEPGVAHQLGQVFAPDLVALGECGLAGDGPVVTTGSAAADLNQALAAMGSGEHAAAATWLERSMANQRGADVPLLYAAVNALLAQDDADARRRLLALPPALPSHWKDWLRKLPHRRLPGGE